MTNKPTNIIKNLEVEPIMEEINENFQSNLPPSQFQKLYDLVARIDERLKLMQTKQEDLKEQINLLQESYNEIMQRIVLLESKNGDTFGEKLEDIKQEVNKIDKRLIFVENLSSQFSTKWEKITNFVIQILWVILAAYFLMKLGLSYPPNP